jgi:membrane protease YdiL (CAAX protease family)
LAARENSPGPLAWIPTWLRAIVSGLLIGMIAANVWPLLLVSLGVPFGTLAEIAFLSFYVWWASGSGPPHSARAGRRNAFRVGPLSSAQWTWGLIGALGFAVTVHAAIVLLFRFIPFPLAAFRLGYDLSFIPTLPLKWVAVVISATSAGICEETGFRGYMQRPIEQRNGAPVAILISSVLFAVIHLSKGWAVPAMFPIVLGAGVLLGSLAWASGSLIFCITGHVVMDVGLFAYWWTGIAGDFTARPISETGVDRSFTLACAVFAVALATVLIAIAKLRRLRTG